MKTHPKIPDAQRKRHEGDVTDERVELRCSGKLIKRVFDNRKQVYFGFTVQAAMLDLNHTVFWQECRFHD